MDTVLLVKNARFKFIEVAERPVDHSLLEQEHTGFLPLGNGICAVTCNQCIDQPTYLLRIGSCTRKIVGNFMLVNGERSDPLTGEQQDFIIQNYEVLRDSAS